jgi:L-ribulose-5-phosphate 3-epimerase
MSVDETEDKLSRLKWSQAERGALVSAMYRTGVPIRTLCLSGHRKFPIGSANEQIRQRGMEIMADAIDLAASSRSLIKGLMDS